MQHARLASARLIAERTVLVPEGDVPAAPIGFARSTCGSNETVETLPYGYPKGTLTH